jgi:hypothetical protein
MADQDVVDRAGIGRPDYQGLIGGLQKRETEQLGRLRTTSGKIGESLSEQQRIVGEADKALQPAEENLQAAGKKIADQPLPKYEKAGDYERPTIDPKEMQATVGAMLAASLLTGLVTRNNLYNPAMAGLTGAMNGLLKGDRTAVDDSLKQFKAKVEAIKERNSAMKQELDDNWAKNKNDMENWKLQRDLIMAKYDRQLAVEAGKTKSLQEIMKMDEAELRTTDAMIQQTTRTWEVMETAKARIAQTQAYQQATLEAREARNAELQREAMERERLNREKLEQKNNDYAKLAKEYDSKSRMLYDKYLREWNKGSDERKAELTDQYLNELGAMQEGFINRGLPVTPGTVTPITKTKPGGAAPSGDTMKFDEKGEPIA